MTALATGLPDIDWPDQAIITVDTGDAAALVTTFTIHLSQDVPPELLAELPPLFASVPTTVGG
jgi:hypothetical protein